MSQYHKIETLYERDEATFKIKEPLILKNRVYGIIKTWLWTEKVDGTNIRCIYRDGKLTFGGKTDNASLPAGLVNWLQEHVSLDRLREVFPDDVSLHPDVVIYGEGYGAGIQKGGGDYSPEKKLIVFDILVGNKWWLADENVFDVAQKLGLNVVPFIGEFTLEEATEMVRKGFKSRCAINPDKDAEGLVGRPVEALFDKKGHRLICKLKTKDFAERV